MSYSILTLPHNKILYLSSAPGYPSFRGADITKDLATFLKLNISAIIYFNTIQDEYSRYGGEFFENTYEALKIKSYSFPVQDYDIPRSEEMVLTYCKTLHSLLKDNRKVLLHCTAGLGRTGTMAAAYLIIQYGYTYHQALRAVRAVRPWAIETLEQENYLKNLASKPSLTN